MDKDTETLVAVARQYYVQSETMEAIAHRMGVSRSTVSRLLKQARDRGLVRVSIVDPELPIDRLSRAFKKHFHVRAHIVHVRSGASDVFRLDQVARTAAGLLGDLVRDGDTIGIAWGTTTSAVAAHLPSRDLTGVTITSLNGGANHQTTGLPYVGSILHRFATAFRAQEQLLALPAFFDDPATKEAMWRERSTLHILGVRANSRIAVFSVGALSSQLQSHVYANNYLSKEDMRQLRENRVVGDVCTVMLRQDGSYRDLEINRRATGMTPEQLQAVPRRICVVSGRAKAAALLGALRARVATDLVIDEEAAHATLDLLGRGAQVADIVGRDF